MATILHLLSQRPSLTGSGITLDAVVRHAAAAGWQQRVVVGTPVDDPLPAVGGLAADHIHPLHFESEELPFPVPGMSDVMPYSSTRFSTMDADQLSRYRAAWSSHLTNLVARHPPDLISSHHLWIMSSMLKQLFPQIPVMTHCHATGFRQMELCPHLADGVRAGCARLDAFAVLHKGHKEQLCDTLQVPHERVHVIGAGYREELFHPVGRSSADHLRLLYIGKLSAAKGLPQLLDAVQQLLPRLPGLRLHVAGSGGGAEGETLAARLRSMAPTVVHHGQVQQERLAELMRSSEICVLPSFYEGLPLVLVEAAACGCVLVATALPGIGDELAPYLGTTLHLVPKPEMQSIDQPRQQALPAFVQCLAETIEAASATLADHDPSAPRALQHFTWSKVYGRVERELLALIGRSGRG